MNLRDGRVLPYDFFRITVTVRGTSIPIEKLGEFDRPDDPTGQSTMRRVTDVLEDETVNLRHRTAPGSAGKPGRKPPPDQSRSAPTATTVRRGVVRRQPQRLRPALRLVQGNKRLR